MSSFQFFRSFLKNPFQVGAVAPSSRHLAKEILRYWPQGDDSVVVEFGPGTGAFSREILERLSKESYFALELNPDFGEKLRAKGIDVHTGSAEELKEALAQRNLQKVDLVVSGLPWALIEESAQKRILSETHEVLKEGGVFSTFAYVHALRMPRARAFVELLERTFAEVEVSKVVWKNLPPALTYHCRRRV